LAHVSLMSDWQRGATIYQIYPRSFQDSDGDGIGDLRGIIQRLDHVASLGVDAIWLSPVFRSPMADYGYDVSNYIEIDPLFGTMADFDALITEVHKRGLKLIIDQIYSHCSIEHAWFTESRASRNNPKADWFVWADAKPDGSPPNNWQAMFGGPSWTWDARRRQYYLHNFLPEQPDLNVRNPQVQDALLKVARFWLERGIDGFRLDVVNFLVQDAQLRDNPALAPKSPPPRPHQFQRHLYDRTQLETLDFIARLRALLDEFGAMAVGEIEDEDSIAVQRAYTDGPERLHTTYSFDLLRADEANPPLFAAAMADWDGAAGWPSWSLSNHDVVRFPTRFANDDPARVKLLLALLMCLRGTAFLYQGDELGLPHANVPFDRLQDPEAIAFWPDGIGRDGARTPMPWDAESNMAGFTAAPDAWLPLDPRHVALAATGQERDPESVLHFARRVIALRKQSQALRLGDFKIIEGLEADARVLAFTRTSGNETVRCFFNLSHQDARIQPGKFTGPPLLELGRASGGAPDASLGPYSSLIVRV
jgi:alpha-glucosidase